MSRFAIVTDSTANLPSEFIENNNIRVIPLKIHWGEETLRDGVDTAPSDFYDRLEKSTYMPKTSQPSSHEFLQTFEELAPHCDGIIVPLISSGISGTVDSALSAQAQFSKVPVEVVDSYTTSAGLALVVIAANQAVEAGKSLLEIRRIIDTVASKVQFFFIVDTLLYLNLGGRIGGASYFLGSVLNIKPILFLDALGKIEALERVRTKRKAMERLVELAVNTADGKPARVAIAHADAKDQAEKFQRLIEDQIDCEYLEIYPLSPVIGTHVGPGTLGVALHTVV